jgi:hypothetical protein
MNHNTASTLAINRTYLIQKDVSFGDDVAKLPTSFLVQGI